MKFVMSYSCGKDSTLALHTMIQAGHTPVCLLVMVNQAAGRSYFHGADPAMLSKYEDALGLPMVLCPSDGTDYHTALEAGLLKARELGAEGAAFGDIDLEGNRAWEEARCRHTGLTPFFPLWRRGREECVDELLRRGFRCLIKSVNNTLLPERLLGRCLDREAVRIIRDAGADVCGENGEYHTLAVDGPVFRAPLEFRTGEILRFGDYSVVDVKETNPAG